MSLGGPAKLPRNRTADEEVLIKSSRLPGFPTPFDLLWQAQAFFFSLVLSLAGVAALWLFGYAFWAILETVASVSHAERGDSAVLKILLQIPFFSGRWSSSVDGWPLDGAALLSFLATAGLLYLGFDRLGALGNRRAASLLLRKARRLLPRPLPGMRRFVELRSGSPQIAIPSEIGWLFFYPDRLEFVGDEVRVTIPRPTPPDVTLRRPWAGLGGAWIRMTLPAGGIILVLPRDNIQRTSDSSRLAPELQTLIAGKS